MRATVIRLHSVNQIVSPKENKNFSALQIDQIIQDKGVLVLLRNLFFHCIEQTSSL